MLQTAIYDLLKEKLFDCNCDERFDINKAMSICEKAELPDDYIEQEKALKYITEDIVKIVLDNFPYKFTIKNPTDTYTST